MGKSDPETLSSMNDLAVVLSQSGKHREAEELFHKTLESRQSILGKEHPHSLASMMNLGNAISSQERYQEAMTVLQEALDLTERLYGNEHPDFLSIRDALTVILYCLGKYQEAIDIHRKNIEVRKRVLGNEHADTLRSLRNLAQILRRLEKYSQSACGLEFTRIRHNMRLEERVREVTTRLSAKRERLTEDEVEEQKKRPRHFIGRAQVMEAEEDEHATAFTRELPATISIQGMQVALFPREISKSLSLA
jgi:tetratricopeptide (TPR) repeat protein